QHEEPARDERARPRGPRELHRCGGASPSLSSSTFTPRSRRYSTDCWILPSSPSISTATSATVSVMLAARMLGITPKRSPSVWLMIGSEMRSWGKVQKYFRTDMGYLEAAGNVRIRCAAREAA